MNVSIRPVAAADVSACATICYEAFREIAERHSFPPDVPSPEVAAGFLSHMVGRPGFFAILAEVNGQIVGSNFMDERARVAGLGPITIDPAVQNKTVGRRLMDAALARAEESGRAGVRLLQVAYHNRSLCLYAKLGFAAVDIISAMQGPRMSIEIPDRTVRSAKSDDMEACKELCRTAHGFDRADELRDTVAAGMANVVEHHGRVTGYSTSVGYFGHSVAASHDDLKALIAAAPEFTGLGLLLPTRNSEVFRWCLDQGLRLVQQMVLMARGEYREPDLPYMPSIHY